MADKPDELLPSAKDIMQKIALAEAEEASKEMRLRAEAEAERKALVDQLTKPSGLSDEEAIQRAIKIIERAVNNRLTEIQVHRFPNHLCTDKGRAINQQEPGWEKTLTACQRKSTTYGTSIFARAATNCEYRSSTFREACRATSE